MKYMIERPLPGAHKLTAAELTAISAKSNAVLRELGPDVQWLHSYVVQDAIVCVYVTKTTSLIEEHAKRGGFPCQNIRSVATMIDASTGGA
jgi:hypothetical protein